MFVGVIELYPEASSDGSAIDALLETGPTADSDVTITESVTTKPLSSYPSVVENGAQPLQGVVIDSMTAWSGITRFLNDDGAVAELLHKEGPLTEKAFESKWALRELLRDGDDPLAYRSMADGSTLTVRATNEKTALAFKLLAQGALGYTFSLDSRINTRRARFAASGFLHI